MGLAMWVSERYDCTKLSSPSEDADIVPNAERSCSSL